MFKKFFLLSIVLTTSLVATDDALYWWKASHCENFGDALSKVVVEKMLGRGVNYGSLKTPHRILFAIGSVLHYARDGDVIWGAGFRENPLKENRFHTLDVRAVRGPRTREFLLKMGITCPQIYGDPALLLPSLFPEFKKQTPLYDYIVIPHMTEKNLFLSEKNVVMPTLPWKEIVDKITKSKLVISSSLHGIIVAEAFGVPARLLKVTMNEPLLKYEDYYEATGRPKFKYATKIEEALIMGGEKPAVIDLELLKGAFPYDYFNPKK